MFWVLPLVVANQDTFAIWGTKPFVHLKNCYPIKFDLMRFMMLFVFTSWKSGKKVKGIWSEETLRILWNLSSNCISCTSLYKYVASLHRHCFWISDFWFPWSQIWSKMKMSERNWSKPSLVNMKRILYQLFTYTLNKSWIGDWVTTRSLRRI